MDRGDWQATVHELAKSQTRLSTHTCLKLFKEKNTFFTELICSMRFEDKGVFLLLLTPPVSLDDNLLLCICNEYNAF